MINENNRHMLHTVRYVLDTCNKVLRYKSKKIGDNILWDICGYCNSDFSGDKEIKVSVSGFCVFVLGFLVSWKS